MERDIDKRQTVEEAAHFFAESRSSGSAFPVYYQGFIAGAEWQAKQSPWIKVGDRNNPVLNDKPYLLLMEDGTVVDERSDWEEKRLLVLAYTPIPYFDEILESNKDVLQRMKENGD